MFKDVTITMATKENKEVQVEEETDPHVDGAEVEAGDGQTKSEIGTKTDGMAQNDIRVMETSTRIPTHRKLQITLAPPGDEDF